MLTPASVIHAVLRVGVGLLFFEHGLQKLFGFFGGIDKAGATVHLNSLMGVAGVLELVGGALLVLGLLTRALAFVLTLEMLTAFAMAHLPRGGWPVQNGGELPLLYAVIFAFLTVTGAGPLSLDSALHRRRRPDLRGGGPRHRDWRAA